MRYQLFVHHLSTFASLPVKPCPRVAVAMRTSIPPLIFSHFTLWLDPRFDKLES
jgi:hypothetical protein